MGTFTNRFKPYAPALIVLTAVLWSLDAFIRTSSLYALPPVLVSFWEHVVGLVVILPFFIPFRKEIATLSRKEWTVIATIAFFGGPIALVAYTYALTQVFFANFSIVVLLQQTQPIWAILMAAILLKERISGRFLALAVAAMAGVYLMVFKNLTPNLSTGEGTVLAGTLAMVAAIAWGASTSMGKFMLKNVSFSTVAFLRFALAAVFSLLIFAGLSLFQDSTGAEMVLGKPHELGQLFSLTSAQWLNLLTIAFISGAGAIMLYYVGLKHVPARVATICELAWPASSLLIDIFIFKNTFTATQVVGMVLLVSSMFVITMTQKDASEVLPQKEG